MLLSDETATSLKLTDYGYDVYESALLCECSVLSKTINPHFHCAVKSFIQLARYMLAIPGAPPFLSQRISQDPLEKFFGL